MSYGQFRPQIYKIARELQKKYFYMVARVAFLANELGIPVPVSISAVTVRDAYLRR